MKQKEIFCHNHGIVEHFIKLLLYMESQWSEITCNSIKSSHYSLLFRDIDMQATSFMSHIIVLSRSGM